MKKHAKLIGASLYIPANHKNAQKAIEGSLVPNLGSLILCTEDSIRNDELEHSLDQIDNLLRIKATASADAPELFFRPRNEKVLERVLRNENVDQISGFVLPKITAENLPNYLNLLQGQSNHRIMITLETMDALELDKLQAIRTILLDANIRDRIMAIRIGGNDLLNLLGLRRPKQFTIYETPLAWVMSQIISVFAPYGFNITAPVFERLDMDELLRQELERDIAYGFVGKTAIHPLQVEIINSYFKVDEADLKIAEALLHHESAAVFKMDGAMCEVTTHRAWAEKQIQFANA